MFFMKCWFVHPLDKNGLTKICFIRECYRYNQLEPTPQLATYDTIDTNFSFLDLFYMTYCLPGGNLCIRHVWRHISHIECYSETKYSVKQSTGTMQYHGKISYSKVNLITQWNYSKSFLPNPWKYDFATLFCHGFLLISYSDFSNFYVD